MSVLNEVIASRHGLRSRSWCARSRVRGRMTYTDIRSWRPSAKRTPGCLLRFRSCPNTARSTFTVGPSADEPLIGAFPNEHLVEFSLDVEWQGRTFVPVLTPSNFQRRIAHALKRKCVGIVARVDFPFPTMEPAPNFGHPNEFNAWYMGELLWEPDRDIDVSLRNWSRLRYGVEAADALAGALRKTEAITQKTFFCQGQVLVNYHNMIGDLSHAEDFLWAMALSKWDPSKRALSESFFKPDENTHSAGRRGEIRGDPAGFRGAARYRAGARQDLRSRSRAASILVREVAGFGGAVAPHLRAVPAPPADGRAHGH